MYMSKPLTEINIKPDTIEALRKAGFTETGNFIESDDRILAGYLSKEQYIDLAIAIAEIKAGLFWEEVHKGDNYVLHEM